MKIYSGPELVEQLSLLGSQWEYDLTSQKIFKIYEFKAYFKALNFVQVIGWLAQKYNHHPDIYLTFGKVRVELTTHDAENNITNKDLDLAKEIEKHFF
ncbi:MAG: 4a-hydroxytetrahydrobiopterin dehydratase [Bacteriovoracaceae bacterium]|nr:4a-hydroxytetrahydrobiopterin dehydratase [Bacteriovoracaceae bacterium]